MLTIDHGTARRFILGKQGLWPGRRWRPLVETAKRHTKSIFLEYLTTEEAAAIRRILHLGPGQFWRACKGTFVDLPPRLVQRLLPFDEESRTP